MEDTLEQQFMSGNDLDLADMRGRVCQEVNQQIAILSKPLAVLSKKTYKIDEEYDLIFQPFGASLKRIGVDGTPEYKPVKSGLKIDIAKLEGGGYTLDELVEECERHLGEFLGKPVLLKRGKYGAYAVWNSTNHSMREITKEFGEITLEDVEDIIRPVDGNAPRSRPALESTGILKVLTADISIRNNKKTRKPYIFYQRGSNKPQFFSLGKYTENWRQCESGALTQWIFDTYIQKAK
jgi:hypothetical protein